jgi:hypothetical protein
MKNIYCKHCSNSCKSIGKTDCEKYQAKANRPEQLKNEIREAFRNENYELAKKLQDELFKFNHG